MASSESSLNSFPHSDMAGNPYAGHAVVGIGMTGLILKLDDSRVVKVAKVYSLDHCVGNDRGNMEYMNDINLKSLKQERSIYERLGNHQGIITCFKTSDYGIELAYAKQGNLETYITNSPEPHESFKREWILAITDTLSYIHSRRVFVDEIALRNFLVADGRLQLADFGQSILLPLATEIDTVCENDLNAKIEVLHLGWIIYSIAIWRVCRYYYFDLENPQWPTLTDLPPTDHLFCGAIIKKCWRGDYISMAALNEDTMALLAK
jgi:serine/threonine protein kinase